MAVAYSDTPQYFVGKIVKEDEMVMSITFMKELERNSFFWPADAIIEDVEKEQVFDCNVRVVNDKNNPKCFLISNKEGLDSNAKNCRLRLLAARKRARVSNSFCLKRSNKC